MGDLETFQVIGHGMTGVYVMCVGRHLKKEVWIILNILRLCKLYAYVTRLSKNSRLKGILGAQWSHTTSLLQSSLYHISAFSPMPQFWLLPCTTEVLNQSAFPPSSKCIVTPPPVWLAEHEYKLYDESAYYFQTWRTSVILVLLKCIFKSHEWLRSLLTVNLSRTIKIKSKLFLILYSSVKSPYGRVQLELLIFFFFFKCNL